MKKLILKIVLSLFLLASISGLIYIGVMYGKSSIYVFKNPEIYPHDYVNQLLLTMLFPLLSAFLEIIILITIIVKGTPYLFSSSLKEYHEHKKATSEARKQKKIEALEKELNELKKNEH